jgi:PAB1-binding protein PBP1
MPCVSTQTTTFLPAVVPVLKSRQLPKRFWNSIARIHGKALKRDNTNRANFQREVSANKKAFLKILKDMTLTVRKNKTEKAKSEREAQKQGAQASKAAEKEQKKFDADVKKFIAEVKKAGEKEKKAADKDAEKATKKADKKAAKKSAKTIQKEDREKINTWDIMFSTIH